MDIANYLSELLGRHGQISVPGLGYFVHVRVNAWYNDAERKFYPPGYKIQFEPQAVEGDDTLTQYIADKKKISLASSKYFTDKYISALKQEASLQEVTFADLGFFFMDKGKIAFKSKVSNTDNAAFFGYEAISIKKLNQTTEPEVIVNDTRPVVSAPVVSLPVEVLAPETTPEPLPLPPPIRAYTPVAEQPEESFEDEPEERRGLSVWAIVLIVIIILGSALFTVYKFKPELLHLNKSNGEEMQLPVEPATKPIIKADSDSIKTAAKPVDTVKAISRPDSALKKAVATPPVVNDTLAKTRYELLAGAFKKKVDAENYVLQYKKMGFTAHILKNVPGRLFKLSLGTYFVRDEAVDAKQKILATGKLKEDNITIQPYNPKK